MGRKVERDSPEPGMFAWGAGLGRKLGPRACSCFLMMWLAGCAGSLVERPSNVLDVLRNVRVAVDDGLLLRADFFTEEGIKSFTGGERATLIVRDDWADIADPQTATVARPDGSKGPAVSAEGRFRVD